MNKYVFLWMGILSLLFFSCKKSNIDSNSYKIQANIAGVDQANVQLLRLNLITNEPELVSETQMMEGKFTFQGKLESPYLHTIVINDSLKVHLFLENSYIDVIGDIGQLDQVKVSGSKEDSIFRSIPMDAIFDKKLGKQIIMDYPNATFSAFTAYYNFQMNDFHADTLTNMMSTFSPKVKESIYYQHLEKLYQTLKKVAIGTVAPNFELANTKSENVSLSDFRGKYVLLDFWASWCVPCREANPTLLKVQEVLKDRNFTILGVSVDKDKQSWLKAVQTDQLSWPNLSNANGWDEVSNSYGVKAVPQNFLIDPQGIIIDKNLEAEQMIEKLKILLPKVNP